MNVQVAIAEEYGRNSAKKLIIHETEIPNVEARIAISLIEKWGMVAGQVEGEDSAGRALLRNCSPEEVVDRACTIADLAMISFRKRGWVLQGPDISKLLRTTDDN